MSVLEVDREVVGERPEVHGEGRSAVDPKGSELDEIRRH